MSGFRAVLFDLDGTLLDSVPDFLRIINELCREHDRPALAPAALRQRASEGARAMLRLAFDAAGDAELDALQRVFLDRYAANPVQDSILFPGIAETLEWLDRMQIGWGIVTNKSERFTLPILHRLALTRRCGSVVCPERVKHPKPDPEALLLASQELEQPPSSTLYLGDHRRDIEAGRQAGMRTLTCAYGYLSPADDPLTWGGEHLVNDARALQPLLQCLHSECTQ